jgi:hypothetical protein
MTVIVDVSVWLVGSLVLGLAVGGILRLANRCQIDEEQAITSWEDLSRKLPVGPVRDALAR